MSDKENQMRVIVIGARGHVGSTVVAEATGYHDAFPGFVPVSSAVVGAAFRRSVEGIETGRVYEAG